MGAVNQDAEARAGQQQRFSVAMATFNGEAYLREQLDSLAGQILLPCELVVCDDGSSDATVRILQKFQKEAAFSVEIYQNPKRLGFANNFLQAASKCRGDWVAFCDQDDIWFPEKLLSVSDAIGRTKARDLVLVTHSVQIEDESQTGRQTNSHNKNNAHREIWSAAALGGVKMSHSNNDRTIGRNCHPGFWVLPGFTCVFRKEMVTCFEWKLRPRGYDGKDPMQGHDRWICMLANALGSVHHIGKPLVLYRRHDAALTGHYERKSVSERIALSKRAGAQRYNFMASVAEESAAVLLALAQPAVDPRWSGNLKRSALLFTELASKCARRAEIYGQKGIKSKFTSFIRLVTSKGYFGNPFYSLGLASFLKDLVSCFAGRVE
jgi:glycosyltransferase involved in cell wall biosynthesis